VTSLYRCGETKTGHRKTFAMRETKTENFKKNVQVGGNFVAMLSNVSLNSSTKLLANL